MNATTSESPAAAGDYCGRENPSRLTACKGSGPPLVSAPPPTDTESLGKSNGLAVFLALLMGQLGLFYVKAWWPALIIMIIKVPLSIADKGEFV